MADDFEFEEMEQIPWSALAAKTRDPRLRVAYIAGGVILAVLLGLLALGWLQSGEAGTVVTLPKAQATTDPRPDPVTVAGIEPTSTTATAPVVSEVYSEADLMAISVDEETRLAIMRAEWFVQDYFSVDGDQESTAELTELVGDQALPHREPRGSSYVEWARAYAVTSPQPARYEVAVAYRTLFAAEDDGFVRAPVRGVVVTIDMDVGGAMTIVELPAPAPLPRTTGSVPVAGSVDAAPDDALAEALAVAAEAGSDPTVLGGRETESGWRFVVEVAGPSGNRWPLSVQIAAPTD